MRALVLAALLVNACSGSAPSELTEGKPVPNDPVIRDSIMKYQQRKIDCLKTSANDDEYLKCVGMKRLNTDDLYCEGLNCAVQDQTGIPR